MQFIKDGEVYKVIRITGPTHNIVGLVFSDIPNCEINVVPLGEKTEISKISAEAVKKQVIEGLELINSELGLQYKIKEIQFDPSDSPSKCIYKELTMEIVNHVNFGHTFIQQK